MFTMSHPGSSCTTSPDIENPCVKEDGGDDSADRDAKVENRDSSSPVSERERVLKQVGFTSTTFIGPAFPPPSTTVQSDIEDSLSEFYKELEKIDTPDGANDIPVKQNASFVQPSIPPETSTSRDTQGISEEKSDNKSAGYQKNRPKQPPRSHWYQNEPYCTRRPRLAAPTQDERHHPQTVNRTTNPRFHRPPFCGPPPPASPNPQNPLSCVEQNWSCSGISYRYQEESHFPTFSSFPPPSVCSPPSQGFYGDSPHHFDRDERGCSSDVYSDNKNVGWSRGGREKWCQFDEDNDRLQRYESESWEHHSRPADNTYAHHPSLVLILMRGLPGSGKSTLARELLSTGPSGLILSTDDYFAHRDGYRYDAGLLGAAHEWNQNRAKDAMHDGRSPIIIDNTNIQSWEMKPYVQMALERGYKVDFCEPDTSWKFDPYELEKRNKHSVSQEKIAQMMDRFSFPISVDIVMSSQEPLHVNQRRRPEQQQMMRKNQGFHYMVSR